MNRPSLKSQQRPIVYSLTYTPAASLIPPEPVTVVNTPVGNATTDINNSNSGPGHHLQEPEALDRVSLNAISAHLLSEQAPMADPLLHGAS